MGYAMTNTDDQIDVTTAGVNRRELIGGAGGALVAGVIGNAWPVDARAQIDSVVRWGIVGTGSIANSMAEVIATVPSASLAAVSSRRMSSAKAFAKQHGATQAYDDWTGMFAAEGVDAIYVATPTGVREEISIAAARTGKHVLAEKPFASLESLKRIIAACRQYDVAFMDGNHFGHHPRTAAIRNAMDGSIGWPWSLTTTFQFALTDRNNIRFNPELEPMGAIGDVGWYCMRAVAEYLHGNEVSALSAWLRRDPDTRAAMSGSGVIRFENSTTCTWNCGYDAGAVFTDLRLTGAKGVITVDDFPNNNPDGSADYLLYRGNFDSTVAETVHIPSDYTSRQLMFEDFAATITDDSLRERCISDSLHTQTLLDRVWESAMENERKRK